MRQRSVPPPRLRTGLRTTQIPKTTPAATLIMSNTRRCYTTPSGLNLSHEKVLGSGTFGTAHSVKSRRGEMFCLKEVLVRTSDEDEKQLAMHEVNLMKACSHPNIVKLHTAWFERNRLFILMELCPTGSLDQIIAKNAETNTHLDEITFRHYMLELASALAHCHDHVGIMHRDLKPANVFIDKLGRLKLGDFGMSKELGPSNLAATFVGTPLYMAPEVCTGSTYSWPADMWALGCVMYELMTLHTPWAKSTSTLKNYVALVQLIQNKPIDFSEVQDKFKQNTIKSVNWMLCRNSNKRARACDIVGLLEMRSPPDMTASMLEPYKKPLAPTSSPMQQVTEKFEGLDVSDISDRHHLPHTNLVGLVNDGNTVLVRQHNLVSDAAKLANDEKQKVAVRAIQKSFRSSMQRKANRMVPPVPKPLTPVDRASKLPDIFKKPAPWKEEQPVVPSTTEAAAAETITKALRTSMNRRRPMVARPKRVGTPSGNNLPAPALSNRLHQLATPRTVVRTDMPPSKPMAVPRRRMVSRPPVIVPVVPMGGAKKAWL